MKRTTSGQTRRHSQNCSLGKAPRNALGKAPRKAFEKAPRNASGKAPRKAPGNTSGNASGKAPRKAPEKALEEPPKKRLRPSSGSTDVRSIAERARASQRAREQKQIRTQKARRKKRVLLVLRLIGLFLIIGVGWSGFWLIRRNVLSATFDEVPKLRNEANATVLDHLLVSDTTGRMLTKPEKRADAEALADLLLHIPASVRTETLGDPEKELQTLVQQAAETASDEAFFAALRQMVSRFANSHSTILDASQFDTLRPQVGSGFYEKGSPYAAALTSPRAEARYARSGGVADARTLTRHYTEPAMRLEANDTAVLSGFSFEEGAYPAQKELLSRLMAEALSHQNILFDLRGISGTSLLYWTEGILPLLTAGTYGVQGEVYFPEGADSYADYFSINETMETFDLENERRGIDRSADDALRSKAEGASFVKSLTLSVKGTLSVDPPAHIGILVDQDTGGAAETFASFAQHLPNIQVLGTATSGTGWKLPPFLFVLPHSGWIASLDLLIAGPLASPDVPPSNSGALTPDLSLSGSDLLNAAVQSLSAK